MWAGVSDENAGDRAKLKCMTRVVDPNWLGEKAKKKSTNFRLMLV